MADRVRYIMDSMALTFRNLIELQLFSEEEVKMIVKKRTDYEYMLRRRQLQADDYNQYLEFEVNLERLRSIRQDKMRDDRTTEKKILLRTVRAAFIRHISYIFERAIRRFPHNLGFWADYISFLKQKKSNTILNTVYGRALSLHPKYTDFWLQAAVHELETNSNTHAARVVLQRGIRCNPNSAELWHRYFDLELWNALRMIERQKILNVRDDEDAADLVEAAPLVVFKHALKSLHNKQNDHSIEEVHPIVLQMHRSCEGLVNRLSTSMERLLRRKYPRSIKLWRHLVHLHVSRALEESANSSTHEAVSSNSETIVRSVALALDRSRLLLHEANSYVGSQIGAERWFQEAVELVNEVVSRCMMVIAELPFVLHREEDGEGDGRAKRRRLSIDQRFFSSGRKINHDTYQMLLESWTSFRDFANELIERHSGAADAARTASSSDTHSEVKLPQVALTELHCFLFSLALSPSTCLAPGGQVLHISTDVQDKKQISALLERRLDEFLDWVKASAPNSLKSSLTSPQWCHAVRSGLAALQRRHYLLDEVLLGDSEETIYLAPQMRRSIETLITILLDWAGHLTFSVEGCELLRVALDSTVPWIKTTTIPDMGTLIGLGNRLLMSIIESPPCPSAVAIVESPKTHDHEEELDKIGYEYSLRRKLLSKGEWCVIFIQYNIGTVAGKPFEECYNMVRDIMRSKSQYFTSSDLLAFYSHSLDVVGAYLDLTGPSLTRQSILSRLGKGNESSLPYSNSLSYPTFAIVVAEAAVAACPSHAVFRKRLAELHRMNGNSKAAEIEEWRRIKL